MSQDVGRIPQYKFSRKRLSHLLVFMRGRKEKRKVRGVLLNWLSPFFAKIFSLISQKILPFELCSNSIIFHLSNMYINTDHIAWVLLERSQVRVKGTHAHVQKETNCLKGQSSNTNQYSVSRLFHKSLFCFCTHISHTDSMSGYLRRIASESKWI